MVEQKLMDYVKKASDKGFSFDDISKLLTKYGYKQRDIDEAVWLVNREERAKEGKKVKKTKLEIPPHPIIDSPPDMPKHIKPKHKPINEIEKKAGEKIQQKFFPAKKKRHAFWIIIEIIGGVIFFAVIGILMYLYLWPALLNVK